MPKEKDISNNELLRLIGTQLENKSNDYYREFDEIKDTLNRLDKKVGIQNGRVTILEVKHNTCKIDEVYQQTEIIRMLFKYPKITKYTLIFVGIIIGSSTIYNIIKLFV